MDGAAGLPGDRFGGGGVECAVEVQECQAVNEGPHHGRQGGRVGGGKAPRTMPRTYSRTATVAAARSSLPGSQGSANITRNIAGWSSAKRT